MEMLEGEALWKQKAPRIHPQGSFEMIVATFLNHPVHSPIPGICMTKCDKSMSHPDKRRYRVGT
jgi:hypothetical protein